MRGRVEPQWMIDTWEILLVDRRPIRLFLNSSDGLGSEESDHINVLAGQAMSKPN